MEPISDKRVVKTGGVVVTPQFSLPPTLDEGEYLIEETDGDDGHEAIEESEIRYADSSETNVSPSQATESHSPPTSRLDVPSEFVVKSQTVKTNSAGQQVVDIVLQVTDVEGATNYEVRISKN